MVEKAVCGQDSGEDSLMLFLIGTKGQLIKTLPVMVELDNRDVSYSYIDSGQHPDMLTQIRGQFGLRFPDLFLSRRGQDLTSPWQIPAWFLGCLLSMYCNRQLLRRHKTIVTQGDTLSTLLACVIGKLYGLRIAHIEAGLRSYSLLHPFPEEIIRRIVSRWSAVCFAPGSWATGNLRNVRAQVVNTRENTVHDTLSYLQAHRNGQEPLIIAAIHRQETIYSRARLRRATAVVQEAAAYGKVLYVLHGTSKRQLVKYGLYDALVANSRIDLVGYQDYITFMQLVAGARFVISDGGGLQEETYFLDVPCLVLRERTERQDGIGETACLCGLNEVNKQQYFLKHHDEFHRKEPVKRYYASERIAEVLTCDE